MKKYDLFKIVLLLAFLLPLKTFALDGNYIITSKLSNDMVLDVAGGNAKEEANIQLYMSHGGKNQQWKLINSENGYYKIESTQDNNYCLDVDNNSYSIKSNVKLSTCNDNKTQHWFLEKDQDGYYKILSYDKQYVVDIAGANPNNKANIQLYINNNNDNQRFIFNKEIEGKKTIENGIYTISKDNFYMNVNSDAIGNKVKINFSLFNNDRNQKWKIAYLNNGTYQISSLMNKDYSLDIPGNKKTPYTNIQLYQNNNGINQQWIIKDNGNGTYQIISKTNGFNLEFSTVNAYVNEESNDDNQNFNIIPTTLEDSTIINDGVYLITSKINDNMVLDVAGGTAKDNTNIQLYSAHYLNHQKWNFIHNDEGYYYIKSELDNNYCLSVSTNRFIAHDNIILKKCKNLEEQRWKVSRDNDGYYKIISNNDDFVLDIAGANAINNTNIQLFDNINSIAQKFILNKYVHGEKTIENGVYEITTLNDLNINVDGDAKNKVNINIAEKNGSDNQKFIITYLDNGYYKIESLIDRKYLMDIAGAKKDIGNNIQLYQTNDGLNQQWAIKDIGNSTYQIFSRLSGMSLDVVNNNVVVNEESNSDTQKYLIKKVPIGSKVIEDGYYFVDAKLNTKKSVDVAGGIAEENKNIQIYNTNSGLNQKWHFVYIEDGYYKILSNINEEYALTMASNNNIQINKYNNSENQRWIVKKNGDNSYSIMNNKFKAISLYNSNTSDKTNIFGNNFDNNDNQKFRLTQTVEGITDNKLENGYYTINSIIDDNYVVDVAGAKNQDNANIQIFESHSKKNQKWLFENRNGYYLIRSGLDNGKVLTVDSNNLNVKLYTENNSYEQQWVLKEVNGESYTLISNVNNLYMSISEESVENKLNIQVMPYEELQSQKFRISKTRLENIVIDISAHNGIVNWDKIKNDGQIYGVILRVAAGSYYIDSRLEYNVNALNRLKIPYGIYIYSYAEDAVSTVPDLGTFHEAKLEALRLISAIENYNINPKLGIYYDLEVWENGRNSNWTSKEYEKIINNFHEVMIEHGYGDWKIYANLNMANSSLYPWRDRITWIAQWGNTCTYTNFYNLWQYTSDGHIDGVESERVDMNIYYID